MDDSRTYQGVGEKKDTVPKPNASTTKEISELIKVCIRTREHTIGDFCMAILF